MDREEDKELEHSFAICAYRESDYLEECIISLLQQSQKSNIYMVTSTPNAFIQNLSEQYGILLIINEGEGGIAQDWNFALQNCTTKYVTIAHQDDTYEPDYAEKVIEAMKSHSHPSIVFTDYGEIRNGSVEDHGRLLRIKRVMLAPMKISLLNSTKTLAWIMKFGNAVCCPSVTYCLEDLQQPVFQVGLKSNLDWETWVSLIRNRVKFHYVSRILMHHRIHIESTTSEIIEDHQRGKEDYAMFSKAWPSWIAKLLTNIYAKSEKYNDVDS